MESSRLSRTSLCSPVKSETYNRLEEDKRYILKKMNYLFVMYAARASRYAFKEMTEKCFMELICDVYESAGRTLHKNSTEWKSIGTIYHGKGKKTVMTYEEFLKLLPQISSVFSHSNDQQNNLKYLLKHLMLVYNNKVSRQIEGYFVEFDCTLKQDTQEYVGKLAENLYIVYKIYFPQEITHQFNNSTNPIMEAYEGAVIFFKEFEIYPKIISASQLYLLFNEIIESQQENMFSWADLHQKRKLGDKGVALTFSKFIELLVHVGRVSLPKLRQLDNPEWWAQQQKQGLKAILQYMQNIKSKNKSNRFKQVRFSFILLDEYDSEASKWLSSGKEISLKSDTKSTDFFDMFEKMKL